MEVLSLSTMIAAASNVIMNFALIPTLGAMGAAIATAVSYFLMWVIRIINTRHIMPISLALKKDSVLIFLLILEICMINCNALVTQVFAFAIFGVILFIKKDMVLEMLNMISGAIRSRVKR